MREKIQKKIKKNNSLYQEGLTYVNERGIKMRIENNSWIKNGQDMLNIQGKRNNKNVGLAEYNCGGYALNIYGWVKPYNDDYYSYNDAIRGITSDECAERTAKDMLETMEGLMRRINSLDELQKDEFGVLYKCGDDDFHFMKYFPESKRFYEKPGRCKIRRVSKKDALSDEWVNGWTIYDSKTIMFALKK